MGAGSSVEQADILKQQQKRIDELKQESMEKDAEIERMKSELRSLQENVAERDDQVER